MIVILGQTATGKSNLAVKIAKGLAVSGVEFEIISADSRQVYKGLDIGTGKITKKEMRGVPHHLLNVVSPRRQFTVALFKKLAEKKIEEIIKRGKIPIIVGGTGFYIQAIIDNIALPEVPPNPKLRQALHLLDDRQLFVTLKKLDPKRAGNIDPKNKVRLVRAIEIAKALGKVPYLEAKLPSKYKVLQIGLKLPDKILKERISMRLFARISRGMIDEAKRLYKQGLSWKRMEELGLEYRYLARYLQGKISKQEMMEQLNTAIWQYAKRQRTWFKRDKRIRWFDISKKKSYSRILKLIKNKIMS